VSVVRLCCRQKPGTFLACDRIYQHGGGCSWELYNRGYLAGLRNVQLGLQFWGLSELPGFDQSTAQKMAEFASGMIREAKERLHG
jgi:hypothetical protein